MTDVKTTTSPTPIADSVPEPSTGPVPVEIPSDWSPDVAALAAAHGDPHIWAAQFAELVGHTTGKWIDQGVFLDWLGLYAQQIAAASNRAAMIRVLNTAIAAESGGDTALALYAYRDQIAQGFRQAAGL